MDLMDRYLQAVRFWLPREQQDDLVLELREDLQAQVEDEETRLGRGLTEAETAAILVRTGEPLRVAGQYLPREPWLDPVLSLVFRFVVKVVLLWVLLPLWLVTALPSILMTGDPGGVALGVLLGGVHSALAALGAITVVFAVLGRIQRGRAAGPRSWDPRKLPALRPARRGATVPRAASVAEFAFAVLFTAWWVDVPRGFPMAWHLVDGGFVWSGSAPLWAHFHRVCFLPMLALGLLNGALAVATFLRPHLVRFRRGAKALLDGAAALCLLLALRSHGAGPASLRELLETLARTPHGSQTGFQVLELVLTASFMAAGFGCALSALVNGVRALRDA
jgi:hypothetical protein